MNRQSSYLAIATAVLATACLGDAAAAAAATTLGTALYAQSDLARTKWSYAEQADLRCRMVLESLVPAAVPDDVQVFIAYFGLLQEVASAVVIVETARQRAMLAVADAIGAYMYSRLLPRVNALYYEGRVDYVTAKRLHNQMKKIKYVLDTDGRGWAKPVAVSGNVGGGTDHPAATVAPDRRCGGVDAGPYGLAAAGHNATVPLFDDDARPHSAVVQWTAGRYALFSVRDPGCYRAVFDHCAREATAGAAPQEPRARALRAWFRHTVRPLTTPEAAMHWCPALWGVRSIARRLARDALQLIDDDDDDARRVVYPPNGYFYAYLFLIEQLVVWSVALVCARQIHAEIIACACLVFGRVLTKVLDI